MNKIKIMHLLTPLTVAGAERVVLNIAKNIDYERFDIHLCVFVNYEQNDNSFLSEVEKLKLKIDIVRLYKVFEIKQVSQVSYLLKKHNIQILHTHSHRADITGFLASRFLSIKIISTLHGWTSSTGRVKVYEALDRIFLKRFNRVIAVSEEIRETLLKLGLRSDRVVTMHNSLDFDAYDTTADGTGFKSEFGLDGCEFLIGFLGRLSVEKGCRYLLLAVKELLRDRKDFKLVLVGDGPDRKKLEELMFSLGISDHVVFCGYRDDVSSFYKAIDVFVLPSLTEGIPISLLESAYFEIPFVATSVGGVSEMFDGIGLLVRSCEPVSLSEKISLLLENKQQSKIYGKSLREYVLKKGDPKLWSKSLESLYCELLER